MKFCWKVDTPGLLRDIPKNPETAVLSRGMVILNGLLGQVAKRTIQLDDPILNDLMFRLALYEGSLPSHEDYEIMKTQIEERLRNGNEQEKEYLKNRGEA